MVVSPEITHPDVKDYFKEIPFYNKPIEKPKYKGLKNIDVLAELPFYKELVIIKTNQAFSGHAMKYKVEIVERKDPIAQLEMSKLKIKNLFVDLLNEMKGFKYQITVKGFLKNTNLMEKLNLIQFISIHGQKQ